MNSNIWNTEVLINPSGYVRSAQINYTGSGLSGAALMITTEHGQKGLSSLTVRGCKQLFGKNYMKGGKWKKVEINKLVVF